MLLVGADVGADGCLCVCLQVVGFKVPNAEAVKQEGYFYSHWLVARVCGG